MAAEVWLRPNVRALLLGCVAPVILAGVGLLLALPEGRSTWARGLGLGILAIAAGIIASLLWHTRLPRLAYDQRHLLVRLRSGPPIRVPIEFVECFWLGQTAAQLPGKQHDKTEVRGIVIRLAEKAEDWRHRDVKPQLGSWCEGYITIRGTWCEPLSVDVVNRLNQRLAEVSREQSVPRSS